jgi:hypothetical protein
MATNTLSAPPRAAATAARSARMLWALIALVLGGVGTLVLHLGGSDHGDVSPSWLAGHPAAWAATFYGGAFAVLGLAALLVTVCVLVRDRGRTWATVSLVIGSIGAAFWAVTVAATMSVAAMGTQKIVNADQANALTAYLHEQDLSQPAVAFSGFLLLLVTQITITVALIRSRAVPLWVPVVFIAGGLLDTAFAGRGALTAALSLPQFVATVAIGWYAWQRSRA